MNRSSGVLAGVAPLVVAAGCTLAYPLEGLTGRTAPDAGHDATPPDESGTDTGADVVSGPPYVLAVLQDQPVAYWRLGESSGTRAADASGHGNDATYVGGVTLGAPGAISGDPDTAASFDGSSGFVDAANRFVFGGDQAFSLEAWVNATSVGGYVGIVSRNDAATGPPSEGYLLFVGPNDGPTGFQRIDGSNLTTVSTTATPSAGSWVHVVAVFDGADMYIYLNGELQGMQTGNFNLGGATSDFVVAAEAGGTGNYFSGAIDEVAVYDKALGADRIKAHWVMGHG